MVGLVLEGGANRTYYSIGVLDAFIDGDIRPDLLVGVSAGIANGISYASFQKGRSLELGMKYIPDKRYMGAKYLFKKGNRSFYNLDFVFNEIPNSLLPFDYESFDKFGQNIYAVLTNVETGKPEYKRVTGSDKSWRVVQASCALPFLFQPIEIDGVKYMDGGCSDPLPAKFAFESGCDKVITILTRQRSYEKTTESDVKLACMLYHRKKEFTNSLKNRCNMYNESRKYIFEMEKKGKAFVFAPSATDGWKRTESRPEMLKVMYDAGYKDGIDKMDDLKKFIGCE